MVFDGVVSPAVMEKLPGEEKLGNLFPPASQFLVSIENDCLFLRGPRLPVDLGVKVIMPPGLNLKNTSIGFAWRSEPNEDS